MSIEEKILDILGEGVPLKAREIASKLTSKYNLQIQKGEINAILYRKLNGKAEQNSSYQWSLKKAHSVKQKAKTVKTEESTPLSKLANYYLECISKDMDSGISVFASSVYNVDYTQIFTFPTERVTQDSIDRHLLDKVRKDKNNFVFKVGYPVSITRRGKDAKAYQFAEPLFIFNVDTENALQNGNIRLSDDEITVNPKAIESITDVDSSSELLLELIELYEELGVDSDPEDKPDFDEIFQRLQQIRSDWNWKQDLNIYELSSQPISSIKETGVYNIAAVFVAEKSRYTAGLEKDLKELSQLPKEDYQKSGLGDWIQNKVQPALLSEKVLIEPIPLNEEQREAVKRGLSSSLTVVTGPPGTGKSQVVANLVVNAVFNGQTVLFSSKNNKAVDVVNERINALSSRQVMLRLGSKFQLTLSEYLSSLLSARPSIEDKERFEETDDIHKRLIDEITALEKQQEQLVELRNQIDKKEAAVESVRQEFGKEFFASCQNLQIDRINSLLSVLDNLKLKLERAKKEKQGFIVKLLWSFYKKSRFAEVQKLVDLIENKFSDFDNSKPLIPPDDTNVKLFEEYVTKLTTKANKAKEVKGYFNLLQPLNEKEDLFQLSFKEKLLQDQMTENSLEHWNNWLQLLPNKMSQEDRKVIGDYISVLKLIVAAETSRQSIDRGVWAKYYSFLPKIMHILSCWAVTSLSARGRIPLKAGYFDLVIIDEASQCDIASAVPLLYRAKRAVIIGDDKQLTHISSISETQDIRLLEKHQLDNDFMGWSYATTSLFKLAASRCAPENIIVLKDHHRSHADIINYSNKFFYEDSLRVATKYEKLKLIPSEPVVRWIDVVGNCVRPESGSTFNDPEAMAVTRELSRLVSTGYKGTIGVVTPFRAQYLRILDKLNQNKDLYERLLLKDFLCDTVHKFQGDEKDVIIFSPVVSSGVTDGSISFLKRTGNLFNVAITRARSALIVVGDKQASYHSTIPHYKGFVEYVGNLNQSASGSNENHTKDFGPKYPKLNTRVLISDWEKHFYEALYKDGIHTIPQFEVGQYSLDLALFKGERKLNIEIDGEKYHRNWDGDLLRRDQLRNKRLIELGWDVQRFWVYQVRDDLNFCINKVKEWQAAV